MTDQENSSSDQEISYEPQRATTGGGGNTNAPPPKKKNQTRAKNYVFTLNNPTHTEIEVLLNGLKELGCTTLAMQEECESTPHIQGTVGFKYAKAFSKLKELNGRTHWEVCKHLRNSIKYCTDIEKRKGRVWTIGIPKPIIDVLEEHKPYEWQQKIIDICMEDPDDRTIYWIYDETGAKGKTTLCKHLVLKKGALCVGGKVNDVKYAVAKAVETGKDVRIVLWDIPRSVDVEWSYEAIESIKNGIFFSGKYESGQCVMNSPHVFIFANRLPDFTMMSGDRWKIMNV